MNGVSIPYRNYPGIEIDRAISYYHHLKSNSKGIDIHGSRLTHLDWDSSILGFPCARLDFASASNETEAVELAVQASKIARELEIKHVSVRFDSQDSHLIQGFLKSGFDVVDEICTFTSSPKTFATDPAIRFSLPEDATAVREIARKSFSVDRFHNDPHIKLENANNLHAIWAENSVAGTAADRVVIGEANSTLAGFVTCKMFSESKELLGRKIGTIVLVATAEWARGQGLGRKMVQQAMNWFSTQSCEIVEVGTQKANKAACHLYKDIGFVETASWVSLRAWL